MEQLVFWDISWTDEDFEMRMLKAKVMVDKLRKGVHVRYNADQKKLDEIDGILEELISFRANRSQAMGDY